jgi:Uma2 family endonuclease
METTQLVSVEEYLRTEFEHDAEYVEGRIVERPMPQKPHSKLQAFLVRSLYDRVLVWPEQRVRTKAHPARYRVPDLCVTLTEPDEDIFTAPPFLCIEILSPESSASELRIKIEEYLAFGVSYVWVIDPVLRTGEIYTTTEIKRVRDGRFTAGELAVDLNSPL